MIDDLRFVLGVDQHQPQIFDIAKRQMRVKPPLSQERLREDSGRRSQPSGLGRSGLDEDRSCMHSRFTST